jgi:SnoaL-like protein
MSVIERLVEAIRNDDIGAFGRLYTNDAVMFEPLLPAPARGRIEIMKGEAALFRAFSDISIEVKNAIEAGGLEIAEVVLSASNDGPLDLGVGEVLPTGHRIHVPMVWSLDLNEDELVIEERDYFDTAQVIEQLGLDQEP